MLKEEEEGEGEGGKSRQTKSLYIDGGYFRATGATEVLPMAKAGKFEQQGRVILDYNPKYKISTQSSHGYK